MSNDASDTICVRRRSIIKAGLALAVAGGTLPAGGTLAASGAARGSNVLVAFYSRSGNTRLVARQIRRARNATLFEIEPSDDYPEDYEATVRQAQDETRRGFRPPLKASLSALSSFDTVFLGFPIWGMTAPPIVRSFLSSHDLSGKTLVPFITHGGYGQGDALNVIARHAPAARLVQGFLMEGEQERRVLADVSAWLGKLNATPIN